MIFSVSGAVLLFYFAIVMISGNNQHGVGKARIGQPGYLLRVQCVMCMCLHEVQGSTKNGYRVL